MTGRMLIGIALCSVMLSGCLGSSGRDSRAGARRPLHATTFVLVTGLRGVQDVRPLEAYAREVARRSGGTLKLRLRTGERLGDPAVEQRILGEVRRGDVALGIVGARAFDLAGVRSFQALLAPSLVTSQRLQDAVVAGPVGDEMLSGVKTAGVTGLALFPGPLRRMLGVTRDYRSAADFAGARIGFQRSAEAAATLRALGAEPVALPIEARLDGVDGYEQQLQSAADNGYVRALRSISANLVLWPRPLVLVGNPAALADLTHRQRQALAGAVPVGRHAYAAATAAQERLAKDMICRAGLPLVRFDTAALAARFHPVYAEIARNATTRRLLARIRALRSAIPADPVPRCAGARPVAGKAGPFDGVYRTTVTAKQQAEGDHVPLGQAVPENYGRMVMVIDHGRFVTTQENARACTWAYGVQRMDGARWSWDFTDGGGIAPTPAQNKPGEHFVWTARLYHGTLSMRGIEPADVGTQRWRRTGERPSDVRFYRRCEPPPEALGG